jgi:hypothetical protein
VVVECFQGIKALKLFNLMARADFGSKAADPDFSKRTATAGWHWLETNGAGWELSLDARRAILIQMPALLSAQTTWRHLLRSDVLKMIGHENAPLRGEAAGRFQKPAKQGGEGDAGWSKNPEGHKLFQR